MSFIIGMLIGAAVAIVFLLAVKLILCAIGFTSSGIRAGSRGASLMSSNSVSRGGGVRSGSIISVCQSVAVVGLAIGTRGCIIIAGAIAGGVISQL